MSDRLETAAFWLSSCNPVMVELAHAHGLRRLVLDLEHGVFDQSELNSFIPLCKALGCEVFAKVLAPEAAPIQQALDFGADGVVIPHVGNLAHARRVTAYAKYPPLGARSYAAGRIVGYGGAPEGFFAGENRRVRCLPMIESAEALADVSGILGLATVDGVFVGPTDLALSCGRPSYAFCEEDKTALQQIAAAAQVAGKPWIMPAWTAAERAFSKAHGVGWMVTLSEHAVCSGGFSAALSAFAEEG